MSSRGRQRSTSLPPQPTQPPPPPQPPQQNVNGPQIGGEPIASAADLCPPRVISIADLIIQAHDQAQPGDGQPRSRAPPASMIPGAGVDVNAHLQNVHNTLRRTASDHNISYAMPERPAVSFLPVSLIDRDQIIQFLHGQSRDSQIPRHSAAMDLILGSFPRNRERLTDALFRIYAFYVYGNPPRRLFHFAWSPNTGGAYSKLDRLTINGEKQVRIVFNDRLITHCELLRDLLLRQMAHAMEYLRPGRYYFGDYAVTAYDQLRLAMPTGFTLIS